MQPADGRCRASSPYRRHCKALAADMCELRELGIVLTLVGSYSVGADRYSNLADALAQVRFRSKTA